MQSNNGTGERTLIMPQDEGIYPKYVVFKHPDFVPEQVIAHAYEQAMGIGMNLPIVEEFVFVLKPGTDRHARVAIAAYAQSVMEEKPLLGEELMQIVADGPRR